MDVLTPQDLFSPSKARQQRAQAAGWAQIDSWLAIKYAGRSPPAFERNEETFEALRMLMASSEKADEERIIVERAEREALTALDSNEQDPILDVHELLPAVRKAMSEEGQEALTALVSMASILRSPTAAPSVLAQEIVSLTSVAHSVLIDIARVEDLQRHLAYEMAQLHATLDTLRTHHIHKTASVLQRQATEHTRQTKYLRSTISDHEDRHSALQISRRTGPKLPSESVFTREAIAELLEDHANIQALRASMKDLENDLDVYQSLPADINAARKEVGRLEIELDSMRGDRDERFERLVSS